MEMEMEMEEVEGVVEKIWELHDKLSDAIHSVCRSNFLRSLSHNYNYNYSYNVNVKGEAGGKGFVYANVKGEGDDAFPPDDAKTLNSIRTALENLEDNLQLFHTLQTQQQAERDAAFARLEQSRIVLALRLADHQGNKYKVIKEAQAFVSQVQNHVRFAPPKNDYMAAEPYNVRKRSNILIKVILSGFNFAKKSLKVDHLGGVFGNAALVALSMLALLHLHQVADRDHPISDLQLRHQVNNKLYKDVTKVFVPEGRSSNGLDVLSARG